jgi:hypothetical protein
MICLFGLPPAWHSALFLSFSFLGLIQVHLYCFFKTLVFGYHHTTGAAKSASLAVFLYRDSPSLKRSHWSVLLFLQSAHPCALLISIPGYFLRFPYTLNTFRCIYYILMLIRLINNPSFVVV